MIDRDPAGRLRFAPLQSEAGGALLEAAVGREAAKALVDGAKGDGDPDSIVLVEGGKAWTHSTAGIEIARRLRSPWTLAVTLYVFPQLLRDLVYRFIARNRYRWFGKSDTCRVPTPELRARFLA